MAERAIPARLRPAVDELAPSVRSARFDHLFVSKLDQPLAPAEFVALDTETNGYGSDLCEMTEVGAVLVGGGELHETFDSLVQVERPLSRGIQRFTGITQGMVDGAPPPEEVLGELADLLEGRVLIAHNARFDVRVLRQAFERAGLDWPSPPALCTVQLARRFAPLARKRALAPLAGSLGIEVDEVHRALPDALTCARVFCALFPKLCANAVTVGDALDLLRSRRRARKTEPGEAIPRDQRPDLSTLPDDPGVYVFRDERGRPLYVGKSVSLRSRARAHFCAPAGWTERAEIVDYRPTNSELGALVLENRLIKQWKPTGNVKLKRTDRYCYLRCRLDIPYPVLEVANEPAPGHAVNVGPARQPRAGERAGRPAHLALPAAPLRAQAEGARAPVGVRADGPLRVALPRRPRPERLPAPARHGALPLRRARRRRGADRGDRPADARGRGRAALRARGGTAAPARPARVGARAARRHAARHAHRAAARARAAPGQGALRRLLDRSGPARGLGPAARSRPSWSSAPRPRCLARPAAAPIPADEIDEVRIVASWIAEHEPPTITLDPEPSPEALLRFAGSPVSRSSHECMKRLPVTAPSTFMPSCSARW